MYRTALRAASRPAAGCLRAQTLRAGPRRFASTTSPADKSRTWKGSAFRWGLAAAAVYYYNTSTVFMDDGASAQRFTAPPSAFSETDKNLPTVDSIVEERKKQAQAAAKPETSVTSEKKEDAEPAKAEETQGGETQAAAGSPEALEEEAGQEGAFNPETGEINWDCPCLGGMAHGPCGEEFKTAFSCFVYSTEEPKGMDCIEKFQGMQECFRQYPEIYGGELDDEADDESADATVGAPQEQQQQQQQEQQEKHQQQQKADEENGPGPTGDAEVNVPESVKSHEVEGEPAPSPAPDKPAVAKSQPSGAKWEDATAANVEAEEASRKGKKN